jgi:hypothetical protein
MQIKRSGLAGLAADCRGTGAPSMILASLVLFIPIVGGLLVTGSYIEHAFDLRHEANQAARQCGTGFALTRTAVGDCQIEDLAPVRDTELRAAAGGGFEVVASHLPFLSKLLKSSLHGESFAVHGTEQVEGFTSRIFGTFSDRAVGRGYTTFVETPVEEAELESTFRQTCAVLGAWCP